MVGREHPEQAYRSCMGILNLASRYDKSAARKGLPAGAWRLSCPYRTANSSAGLRTKAPTLSDALPAHDNIRGRGLLPVNRRRWSCRGSRHVRGVLGAGSAPSDRLTRRLTCLFNPCSTNSRRCACRPSGRGSKSNSTTPQYTPARIRRAPSALLVDQECTHRASRRVQRRTEAAAFPIPRAHRRSGFLDHPRAGPSCVVLELAQGVLD